MRKNTKIIAVLSLSFTSMVTLVIAGIPSNNFAFAEKEVYSTEFISSLAKRLDSTSNEVPETITFASSNGVGFSFETYRCSKDSNNIKIQKGGYIRNITAINGLLKIKDFQCDDPSIASFVDCEADSNSSSFSPTNAFKGDSTCKEYAFEGTNFILKSDGDLTVSSLEVCYSCEAGSNGFITSDNPSDVYSYNNECEYYGYGADGTSIDTPYIINGEEAFLAFAKEVNAGNSYSGSYFKLDTDLDFTKDENLEFIPVGSIESPFEGRFNALNSDYNHKIKVERDDFKRYEDGIFGAIINDAVVENLDVEGTLDLGNGFGTVGGIVGYAEGGTIKNCNSSCYISGNDISGLGGILGVSYGNTKVINCHVSSEINIDGGCSIGGLIGFCDDTCFVKDCTFEGCLKFEGDNGEVYNCGGLIGEFIGNYPSTSIQNCSILCNNCDDISKRLPNLKTSYVGLLLGQDEEDYQSYRTYIGCEVGYADNSDCPEILLKPGCWDVDGAWFAVYCWGEDEGCWYLMEKDIASSTADSNNYVAKVDTDLYDRGLKFVRMKKTASTLGFDESLILNETGELTYSSENNIYSVTGTESNSGSWGFLDRNLED